MMGNCQYIFKIKSTMRIKLKECEPIGTNAYCLLNDDLKQAILVDAPLGSFEWSSELCKKYNYELVAVLLTHGHWDHILDAHLFNEQKIPLYGHRADSLLFEQPERMMQYAIPGINIRALEINHWIETGAISVGEFSFEVFEVPGHCPGSLMFYQKDSNAAFVGDAIFAGGVGRCDLPGGDFKVLEASILNKIYTLPLDTQLYPGHGPMTTVRIERSGNPFVSIP
jgi:hydroxyacylglutathione hydrolase